MNEYLQYLPILAPVLITILNYIKQKAVKLSGIYWLVLMIGLFISYSTLKIYLRIANRHHNRKITSEEKTYLAFKDVLDSRSKPNDMIMRNYRPNFLTNPKTGKPLEYDIYHPELRIAVEYNGIQHYEYPNPFHKTKEEFDYQVEKDQLKQTLSDTHGVCLISVPYTVGNNSANKKEELQKYLEPRVDACLKQKPSRSLQKSIQVHMKDFLDFAKVK